MFNDYLFKSFELHRKIIEQIAPLKKEGQSPEIMYVDTLFMSLFTTGESIFLMLEKDAVHDADILLRSVFDGTIKYLYLIPQDKEKSKQNIDIYSCFT